MPFMRPTIVYIDAADAVGLASLYAEIQGDRDQCYAGVLARVVGQLATSESEPPKPDRIQISDTVAALLTSITTHPAEA